MSHRDYVNLCNGYADKLKREEILQRKLNYNIVLGWADRASLPPMHIWWKIDGEEIPKVKLPTKKQLIKYDTHFRSLGKKK